MKHFAIIYDSKTGTTKQAADWIAEGMQAAGDADAKCFSIPDVDLAFVRDADGVILGAPTYFASLPGTMKTGSKRTRKGSASRASSAARSRRSSTSTAAAKRRSASS